jgi:hypothetical protein
MKVEAATGPPRVAVQRGFEGNRLAKGFQARAYEQVLALVDTEATPSAAEPARQKSKQTTSGGIAA